MKEFTLIELGKRIGQLLLSLFVLLIVTFVIGRILPTDPVGAIVGELADPAAYQAMRARLGLDLPVYEQFWLYLTSLLHGDLGTAILTGNPVLQDLAQAFPATLELATLAVILSTLVGVPLGMTAAFFRDTWIDKFTRVISLVGHSIPVFWFGIVGLVIFYAGLEWVGSPGRVDVYLEGLVEPRTGLLLVDSLLAGDTEVFWNAVHHIILPACILAYSAMAYITRMTRSFTLEQLNQDYVIAARAKGASSMRIVTGHLLPNIAVQLITVLAISYGGLLEGAVVTEIVFSWPGIGQYMTNALMTGDMNAILAGTLIIGLIFMLLNFLSDLAYLVFDPRTREVTT
ncbi:peptide/nickel transport system permease protein [Rhizobium sp. PP-F2F-G38]|uniref:ABC transporter permease n=1 Tax=Rhizobium sp. PP-CC-3G-465 TaxID=2135648 RepID=UPI000D861931|nr:peptide/nickel transport system permease protein [Rhizobium sp. PP-WC-1G-195]PYE94060.1 peptide/nickel transport system permease protein [Rhizobium sp. PP-F2F-G38]TCP82808.1 peptide/nickel transport system permease protein [Rhizobium sp. PP-CC-2G-626]TCQ00635.1 peptide/nickel transport system permease protein [Rhizobium sp. PP-F2F-G36]TCQ20057.1 peptide/nickel transport system permease protein [Rhizobium sp. PP-CC-3G-465]